MASPSISNIEVYATNLLAISFVDEVVVNDDFYSVSNYSIDNGLEVIEVLREEEDTSLQVILHTQVMVEDVEYTITINNIVNRLYDSPSSLSGSFIGRNTKLNSILRSIPSHYDKRVGSKLHTLLTAVAASDDLIGGSRNDSITFG